MKNSLIKINKLDLQKLDKKVIVNLPNKEFMETIMGIAEKYNIFTNEDITFLTSPLQCQEQFKQSGKAFLLEVTNLNHDEISDKAFDHYDNGKNVARYYPNKKYHFNNREFIATNDLYGKYKNGHKISGDNRTPFYEWFMKKINTEGINQEGEPQQMNDTKQVLTHVHNYITSQGFSFPDGLIENFYLSLKSKPFVILAGISGTGKTRIVKLFSEAINAKYKIVPVRPDWSDSSDLFGHVDLNGKFIPGAILDFINDASRDEENRPYLLCLDEMNLARVEYYMSDFLSVIETRDMEDGKIVSKPLVSEDTYGTDTDALDKYGELYFPNNLYIVGTVNMDETTFPFSKKVLDRANTIEFSYVDFDSDPFKEVIEEDSIEVNNDFLKSDYLFIKDCKEHKDVVTQVSNKLKDINKILEVANLHVGYRVRDEVSFYMINNDKDNILNEDEALDNQIMQKILPRIQGSSIAIKNILQELFKYLTDDKEVTNTDQMLKIAKESKYKNSAVKIVFMIRRFEEDGFTSFWL